MLQVTIMKLFSIHLLIICATLSCENAKGKYHSETSKSIPIDSVIFKFGNGHEFENSRTELKVLMIDLTTQKEIISLKPHSTYNVKFILKRDIKLSSYILSNNATIWNGEFGLIQDTDSLLTEETVAIALTVEKNINRVFYDIKQFDEEGNLEQKVIEIDTLAKVFYKTN